MEYRAIILADRSGAELAPLDQIACPALLEVAGKTVIEYTLEDLSEAGFREAIVVTSSLEAMRARLGDGERWGIRLRYLLVKADSEPASSLARVTAPCRCWSCGETCFEDVSPDASSMRPLNGRVSSRPGSLTADRSAPGAVTATGCGASRAGAAPVTSSRSRSVT